MEQLLTIEQAAEAKPAETTVQFPVIGTYTDVADALKIKKSTAYKMTCRHAFKPGIYIGQGRFNMSRLRDAIEREGSHLKGRAR